MKSKALSKPILPTCSFLSQNKFLIKYKEIGMSKETLNPCEFPSHVFGSIQVYEIIKKIIKPKSLCAKPADVDKH